MTQQRIALYGGSFNPPGCHHRRIVRHLAETFDEVIVVPCGPRPDKPITNDVEPVFRAAMVDMTFQDLAKTRVELFDLERDVFTRTWELEERFEAEGELWHVIGSDLVRGGGSGQSPIQLEWARGAELWKNSRFAVLTRPGAELDSADLPPHHELFEFNFNGSSSEIRERVYHHKPITDLVLPAVERYIHSHNLYRGIKPPRTTRIRLDEPKLEVIVDRKNPQAVELAKHFPSQNHPDPNLILVIGGDGTMLRSIREHWRRRIPLYGINAGHMGFLLNEPRDSKFLHETLLIQQLPLLHVETVDSAGNVEQSVAFNDAWVERDTGQSAWIQVSVDNQIRVQRLVGDGALVATAAGSGSYARAMGAAPMSFDTPSILLVGSNVLKPPFWKPVVLSLDARVELTNLDPIKRPWRAHIDGELKPNVVTMRTRVSRTAAVELAFDEGLHPSEKLALIQFPPPES